MRRIASKRARKGAVAVVALVGALVLGACSAPAPAENLAVQDADEGRTVNFFSPMEKISPDTENTARTASDLTIAMAEERLGLTLAYHTYTAENYQDKTYDDVCLERARNNSDDLYLLNTDTIVTLGSEGHLADLSGLSCAQNLREVVRAANTVDGKLVAIPQEVVAYGLRSASIRKRSRLPTRCISCRASCRSASAAGRAYPGTLSRRPCARRFRRRMSRWRRFETPRASTSKRTSRDCCRSARKTVCRLKPSRRRSFRTRPVNLPRPSSSEARSAWTAFANARRCWRAETAVFCCESTRKTA